MCVIIDLWYSSLIFACIRKKARKVEERKAKPRSNTVITTRSRAEEPQVKLKQVLDCAQETMKRLRDTWKKWETKYIRHIYICNDTVPMFPPNATFSNCAARPLNPQDQHPMGSAGSNHIRSEWCHLSSWFVCHVTCHVSLRSSTQVLERIIEKLSAWEQFLERILRTVAVHPSNMWPSQTARFVLWCVLSRRARSQYVLRVQQEWAHAMSLCCFVRPAACLKKWTKTSDLSAYLCLSFSLTI